MELFTNFSKSLLAAGISSGSATVTVSAGTGALFPAPTGSDYARLVIFEIGSSGETNQEIVLLTARGGDTLTITRAQEGTTARAFSAGAYIALRPTASTLTDMRPNSLHVKKTVLFESEYDAGNSGAAVSIDFTNGQKQKLTLTANATVTLTAPASDRVGHFQLRDRSGRHRRPDTGIQRHRGNVMAELAVTAGAQHGSQRRNDCLAVLDRHEIHWLTQSGRGVTWRSR